MKKTRVKYWVGVFVLGLGFCPLTSAAPLGTGFTYQGDLQVAEAPGDGVFDFEFDLFPGPLAGASLGAVILNDVLVADGKFTVVLDFGGDVFNGENRWLQIRVRPGASIDPGDYVTLADRQPITAAPYALQTRGIFVQDSTGYVGIGTTTPFDQLEVATTGTRAIGGYANAESGLTSGVYGFSSSTQGRAVSGFASRTSGFTAGIFGQSSSEDGRGVWGFANSTSGTPVGVQGAVNNPNGYAGYFLGGRNYFEGRVGIGTAGPRTDLEIKGASGLRVTTGQHSNVFGEFIHAYSGGLQINANAGGGWADISLQTDRTTRLFIESEGNIGFKTTDPRTDLEMKGTTGLRVTTGQHVNVYGDFKHAYSGGLIINSNADGGTFADISLQTNGVTRMFIESAGKVGIGTTSIPAGVALAVDGEVLCEEVTVMLSQDWPDYVFAEDYDLMPLEELGKVVRKQKHLPDVPSAERVAQEGIPIGEMQATLLQKIEELTLYVVDLHKELGNVKRDNLNLRQRVVSLESVNDLAVTFGVGEKEMIK